MPKRPKLTDKEKKERLMLIIAGIISASLGFIAGMLAPERDAEHQQKYETHDLKRR